jgi:hypothetical protein
MPSNNAVNVSSAGMVGFTGTAFVETTTTNHAILIGGATSSTFSNVGPTSTAGQVLQSGGASADPSFSTPTYPSASGSAGTILRSDGTNNLYTTATYPNTTTINQILFSSATNTIGGLTTANGAVLTTTSGGVPQLTALTDGQVLIGSTAGSPVGATITAGAGTTITSASNAITVTAFNPNAVVAIRDDFIGIVDPSTTTLTSGLIWNLSPASAWGAIAATENGHPGIIRSSSATNTASFFLNLSPVNTTQGTFILGGGVLTLNWVFKIVNLSTGTNRYTIRIGMGDTNGADQVNGCYFEYSDNINSGNWNIKTASASTRTTTSSSTAVTTGWHNAQISINAAASSVTFTMDGVSLGSIATNIPTTAILCMFDETYSAGSIATGTFIIDLFYLTQVLTTPR